MTGARLDNRVAMSTQLIQARSFSPALFAFLKQLAMNNDREWFAANKARYVQHVQEPALAFVEDFAPLLHEISPHFVADARTVGGSLYRIYRDTRFSKDKTPYKTHAGIHFRHVRAKDAPAPGFYLHLEPGNVFMGCGSWRPDSVAVRAIRGAIAAYPERWRAAVEEPPFAERFRLGGESLKRPPAGFDADHPLIEHVKRKDFIAIANLTQRDATAKDFLQRWDGLCRRATPFMRFLCDATGMPF
jgi:uncharacterized protein (TIGR02453 family)